MYTGKLYLDFDDDNEESHYVANVSRCLIRENELVMDFNGKDEGRAYQGSCRLSLSGENYIGKGTFCYEGEKPVYAAISLILNREEEEIFLTGMWRDDNDAQAYKLEVELHLAK